jgi:hypothetical protein
LKEAASPRGTGEFTTNTSTAAFPLFLSSTNNTTQINSNKALPAAPPLTLLLALPSSSPNSAVVNTLLSRVQALPPNTPERQKALEIAQALVQCIDSTNEARIAAAKAEEHARNAELHRKTVDLSMERLLKLVEKDAGLGLDGEVVEEVKKALERVGEGGK